MYEAVLGKEGFRKGMDLYFQRHDGQVRYRCTAVLLGSRILACMGASTGDVCCKTRPRTSYPSLTNVVIVAHAHPTTHCHPALQAVTCDDFLAAMADANGEDLSALGK